MRVAVYGNCQAGPIGRMLQIAAPGLEVIRIAPVHTIPPAKRGITVTKFQEADVVLSQPIGAAFGPLSTEALRSRVKNCDWVIYPSIYFCGLFPYLQYFRRPGGKATVKGPLGDYHDSRILRSFAAGLTEQECALVLEKVDVDGCRNHFINAMEESCKREAQLDIRVMEQVRELVRKQRCFYTFNHPSNLVMWHVAIQFLEKFSVPLSTDARPPVNQFLDEVSAAIPAEMASAAGLSYTEPSYCIRRETVSMDYLIESFYLLYRQLEDFSDIYAYNVARSSM